METSGTSVFISHKEHEQTEQAKTDANKPKKENKVTNASLECNMLINFTIIMQKKESSNGQNAEFILGGLDIAACV